MSKWTHAICEADWVETEGTWEPRPDIAPDAQALTEVRRPTLLTQEAAQLEKCCWCGRPTIWGAYKRADPASLPCKGDHDE